MGTKAVSYVTLIGGRRSVVELQQKGPSLFSVWVDGVERRVDSVEIAPGSFSLLVDDRPFVAEVCGDAEGYTVDVGGTRVTVQLTDASARSAEEVAAATAAGPTAIRAMMPGRVVALLANPGESVKKGAGILVVEAMKMENEVTAPAAGKIVEIRVEPGQTVETGQVLAVIE